MGILCDAAWSFAKPFFQPFIERTAESFDRIRNIGGEVVKLRFYQLGPVMKRAAVSSQRE